MGQVKWTGTGVPGNSEMARGAISIFYYDNFRHGWRILHWRRVQRACRLAVASIAARAPGYFMIEFAYGRKTMLACYCMSASDPWKVWLLQELFTFHRSKLALLPSTWEVELHNVRRKFVLICCIPRTYVLSGEHS